MRSDIKQALADYARQNPQISSMFFIRSDNDREEFSEVFTVVDEIIIGKLEEDLAGLFPDFILQNRRKETLKFEKKSQNYTILELFRPNSIKISERIISKDLAGDLIGSLPEDLEFIYDEMDLSGLNTKGRFVYDLPKEYEFSQCTRDFFASALETSFLLLERNDLAASFKFEEVHSHLLTLLNRYVVDKYNRMQDGGKRGERLQKTLTSDYKDMLKDSFAMCDYKSIYEALFKACQIFRKIGMLEAENLSFTYLKKEDVDTLKVLRDNYHRLDSLYN